MEDKDSLIVLSGGMDSVTLLHDFASSIALAVTFNYGSNHSARGVESSLLSGADAIPEGHYTEPSMKSTVVPFRNGIMLAVAAGLAESRGLKAVMLANHSGDHAIYPDCRPGFVKAMDNAIKEGTYDGIRLVCPYTDISKGQIAMRGRDLGIDYSTTYSCYKGREKHCGRCGTCVERREALAEAGIADNTVYED